MFDSTVILVGCAYGISMTKYSVIPIAPKNGPIKATLNGGQVVATQMKQNLVSVYVEGGQVNPDLSSTVYVAVKNNTSKPIKIHPKDVFIYALNGDKKEYLMTYLRHEVLEKIEQKYQTQAAFRILLGGLISAAESYNASHQYYSGNINGHIGNIPVYGSYSGQVYNPAAGRLAASIENMRTERDLNRIYDRRNAELFTFSRVLFDGHTVGPQKTYAGAIKVKPTLDIHNLEKLQLKVTFGGQNYLFDYAVMINRKI